MPFWTDEAFAVLSALAASGELATIYGAMPADPAQTQPFKDAIETAYPNADLDWAVPEAMLGNPGPGLRQEQGRLAGLRCRLSNRRERGHRRRPR